MAYIKRVDTLRVLHIPVVSSALKFSSTPTVPVGKDRRICAINMSLKLQVLPGSKLIYTVVKAPISECLFEVLQIHLHSSVRRVRIKCMFYYLYLCKLVSVFFSYVK